MKYLLVVLSTLLFLSSCTGSDAPVAEGDGATEIVISEPDGETAEDPAAEDSADEDPAADEAEGESEEDAAENKEDDKVGLDQKNVKLTVNNQKTAGQIIVKTVSTARDGWVSVHKSKTDGSILLPEGMGEARVDSGDSEEVIIDLWEAPAVGDKLWVLLHIDGGERGTYEYPGKDAPVKKNGETMARSFVIQGEKEEKKESDE